MFCCHLQTTSCKVHCRPPLPCSLCATGQADIAFPGGCSNVFKSWHKIFKHGPSHQVETPESLEKAVSWSRSDRYTHTCAHREDVVDPCLPQTPKITLLVLFERVSIVWCNCSDLHPSGACFATDHYRPGADGVCIIQWRYLWCRPWKYCAFCMKQVEVPLPFCKCNSVVLRQFQSFSIRASHFVDVLESNYGHKTNQSGSS